MVNEEKCRKCGSGMTKRGTMNSGNSTFQIYECKCGNKELRALGVNQ